MAPVYSQAALAPAVELVQPAAGIVGYMTPGQTDNRWLGVAAAAVAAPQRNSAGALSAYPRAGWQGCTLLGSQRKVGRTELD